MKIEISTTKQYRLHEGYYPKMGLKEIEGRIYDLHNLPDNLTIKGSLDLSENNITSLPEGLKVGGNLYLYENKLTSLPENLEVEGDLDLRKNNFPDDYKIPKSVKIGGRIHRI